MRIRMLSRSELKKMLDRVAAGESTPDAEIARLWDGDEGLEKDDSLPSINLNKTMTIKTVDNLIDGDGS